MRRRHESQPWSCLHGVYACFSSSSYVHTYHLFITPKNFAWILSVSVSIVSRFSGGASCSVMALVDGRLFSANVGDSSTLLSVFDVEGEVPRATMVPLNCAVRLCDLGSAHLQDSTCGFHMERAFLADAQASMGAGQARSAAQLEAEDHLNQMLASTFELELGKKLSIRGETLPHEQSTSFVVTADHSPEAHTEVCILFTTPAFLECSVAFLFVCLFVFVQCCTFFFSKTSSTQKPIFFFFSFFFFNQHKL
jgi:hypothetical protein